jgi:hypothetical protein
MKERPILFSGAMVRALLDGSKTQTRRLMTLQPVLAEAQWAWRGYSWACDMKHPIDVYTGSALQPCPCGSVGDRLYVRETWAQPTTLDPGPTLYRADYPACVPASFENIPAADEITWKPSIHMPQAMSRIALEVTGVRVERLQDISNRDSLAEGLMNVGGVGAKYGVHGTTFWSDDPREAYRRLWDSLNAARGYGWDVNPWVWVVEFRKVESRNHPF